MSGTLGKCPERGRLEAQDLVVGFGAIAYALFSLAWPETGHVSILGAKVAQGYGAAAAFACVAVFSLGVVPRLAPGRPLVDFVRRFYPQALYAFFFTEGILLSSQAGGGFSHDAAFAAMDRSLFGFQPSIEFSKAFSRFPAVNELMFGAYFSFYAILSVTSWIPYFKGDREEAARQVYDFSAVFVLLSLWYVFFRVQGPKYWFPELHEAWYGGFKGGIFVSFFQSTFDWAILSGAAFPSSHVLISLLFVRAAARVDRRLLWIYVPLFSLLACSTVYIYAHYAADAIAGAILSPLLARAVEAARPRLEALCAKYEPLGAEVRR